jgi:hypothetical protein
MVIYARTVREIALSPQNGLETDMRGRLAVLADRRCAWCGESLDGNRSDATYCTARCRLAAFHAEPCAYCGCPSDARDHVVPRAYRTMMEGVGGYDRSLPDTVPACTECNSIAGAKVFPTLDAKRRFIQGELAERYAKALAAPDWTDEDLAQLGHALRADVARGQRVKTITRGRLAWRG